MLGVSRVTGPLPRTARLASGVPPPTAALNATAPVPALMLSGSAPSTVPLKLTAAFASLIATGPVARVTGLMKVIAPLAGPALEPTLPLTVMPPGAVKVMGPATARPLLGRLRVSPVTLSAVRVELGPISFNPVTVPAPPERALSVRFSAPPTGAPKLMLLPLESHADRAAGHRQAAVEGHAAIAAQGVARAAAAGHQAIEGGAGVAVGEGDVAVEGDGSCRRDPRAGLHGAVERRGARCPAARAPRPCRCRAASPDRRCP